MALHLTPEILEAAYEFLRTTPPFRRWKLPHADDVKFVVSADPCWRGYYICDRRHGHTIAISGKWIGHTANLIATMAHEMIHLYQSIRGLETRNVTHNADFRRIAARVCKHHGFDPRAFL